MDFSFSEEEQMVLGAAGAFADKHLAPTAREHESAGAVGEAVAQAFDQTGLVMLGEGSDPELPGWPARVAAVSRMAEADAGATLALWTEAWLPVVARAMGVAEAHVSSLGGLHLVHRMEDTTAFGCLPLTGRPAILVLDQRGRWGVGCVNAVPIRALGLKAAGPSRATSIDWAQQGEVGVDVASQARATARLWGAALAVGIASAALAYTNQYVQERVAFGKTLSCHQGVAFLCADMAIRTEGASVLLSQAAWDFERGNWSAATDAWLEAGEVVGWVTDTAVQLLGGHGYMQDHPVEKWMRDARALTLLWGGPDAALAEAAQRVLPAQVEA